MQADVLSDSQQAEETPRLGGLCSFVYWLTHRAGPVSNIFEPERWNVMRRHYGLPIALCHGTDLSP